MKTLSCRDVGVDCDWKTSGKTEDEILKAAALHGSEQHGFKDLTPELIAKVKGAIREVPYSKDQKIA